MSSDSLNRQINSLVKFIIFKHQVTVLENKFLIQKIKGGTIKACSLGCVLLFFLPNTGLIEFYQVESQSCFENCSDVQNGKKLTIGSILCKNHFENMI